MHIVVDAHHTKPATTTEQYYTLALLYKLCQCHPEHHFTIITGQAGLLPALKNTSEYINTAPVNSFLQVRRWLEKLLPDILHEMKADTLISVNGAGKTELPYCVFLSSPTAAERHYTSKFLFPLFKKYLVRQIVRADAIATFTSRQQTITAKQLKIKTEAITPVGYAVPSIFKPVGWQQKEAVLEEYTSGREYFLYTGSFTENHLLLLLKAFSFFKKRQLSSMQLIIAGNFTPGKIFEEKLASYKYRADIKWYETADLQKMALLTPAAYAVIILHEKDLTAFTAAAALQCEVPVIGLENSAVQEVTALAGLYASAIPESLAGQMKLLYKDENLRKQLIAAAAAQLPQVNGDVASQKLWDCIDMATSKIRLHLPAKNERENDKH